MEKLDLPQVSERIRGLTLPVEDVMHIADYDEVYRVSLLGERKVHVLEDDPYEFIKAQKHILGVTDHLPILEKNGNSISYKFWPPHEHGTIRNKINNLLGRNKDFVRVSYEISNKKDVIDFHALSGDWFAASFSECGDYLVLAEPYSFDVYKI